MPSMSLVKPNRTRCSPSSRSSAATSSSKAPCHRRHAIPGEKPRARKRDRTSGGIARRIAQLEVRRLAIARDANQRSPATDEERVVIRPGVVGELRALEPIAKRPGREVELAIRDRPVTEHVPPARAASVARVAAHAGCAIERRAPPLCAGRDLERANLAVCFEDQQPVDDGDRALAAFVDASTRCACGRRCGTWSRRRSARGRRRRSPHRGSRTAS